MNKNTNQNSPATDRQKYEFNQLLSNLIEKAQQQNQELTKNEIDSEFSKIGIPLELHSHIYDYLKSNHISILSDDTSGESSFEKDSGNYNETIQQMFTAPEGIDLSGEEQDFLQMYYDDLQAVPDLSVSDKASVIRSYYLENSIEKNNFIEYFLSLVLDILPTYKEQGVSSGDLIQEGNLGLMEGIVSFLFDSTLDDKQLVTAFQSFLMESIESAMQQAIREQSSSSNISEHLAARANTLDHASRELAKKLDREPTLEELSKHLGLPEDEIRNIMKYSLDALTIQADTKVV